MRSVKTKTDRPWISCAEVSRRLGCTLWYVRSLTIAGRIRTLVHPGIPVKFSAEDVEELAAEMKGTGQ